MTKHYKLCAEQISEGPCTCKALKAHYSALGRVGGSAKSLKKTKAVRQNARIRRQRAAVKR